MGLRFLTVACLTAAASLVATAVTATAATPPQLKGAHPCPGQPGFTCATLTVPLDHTRHQPGSLDLPVATADNVAAPKGVLLFLTGGPGQGGVGAITRIARQRLPELAADYRFVMLDQRGTGAGALDCPQLQVQVGGSDIAVPTPAAVRECAGLLGDRAGLYGTDQTVADFDLLRRALGVDKMVVDGVSYGSFTAARYAIAQPGHVAKLVLDSVVPHHYSTGWDSIYLTGLSATARVFRAVCAEAKCGFDPAEDLAWVVRHRSAADGVRIYDAIVDYEFSDPTYHDLIAAIHSARGGESTALDGLLADSAPGGGRPADFSSGLHTATLCTDNPQPWGNAATPRFLREPLLELSGRLLPERQVWPFTQAVAIGQGYQQTCLDWPVVRPGSNPAGPLPKVPTLLLNGDHDLSTPLELARQELRSAPDGKLVVVPGAAHSIQNRERGHTGRDAVISFLNR
ncbi:alpha/beta fold hydrolase [Kutzneria viridogrisea]|uniref:prolyl aminopeptidase n=1 Tax=Kutzneria viridogrisea TaxID=47990 RepID=A0ABR6BB66_9PSEU|nr:pimeloyl-ACP methyl ester carboxylesterase [Kutzneria viridogrisea]